MLSSNRLSIGGTNPVKPMKSNMTSYIVIITTLSEFLSEHCVCSLSASLFISLVLKFKKYVCFVQISIYDRGHIVFLKFVPAKSSYRNVARFENELFYLYRRDWNAKFNRKKNCKSFHLSIFFMNIYLHVRNMFNTKFIRRVLAVASVVQRMRLWWGIWLICLQLVFE